MLAVHVSALLAAVPRRLVLSGAAATAVGSVPHSASAWCGSPFPSWAYFLQVRHAPITRASARDLSNGRSPISARDRWRVVPQWDEASVTSSGETFCRVVGDAKREAKAKASPALLIPTPGARYDYMENLCDDDNNKHHTNKSTSCNNCGENPCDPTREPPHYLPGAHGRSHHVACDERVCAPHHNGNSSTHYSERIASSQGDDRRERPARA